MSTATSTNICGATTYADLAVPTLATTDRSRKRALTEARREQNRLNQRVFRQKQRAQRHEGHERSIRTPAKRLKLHPRPAHEEALPTPITVQPARALDGILRAASSELGPIPDGRVNLDLDSTQSRNFHGSDSLIPNGADLISADEVITGSPFIPLPSGPTFSCEDPNLTTNADSFEVPYPRTYEDFNLNAWATDQVSLGAFNALETQCPKIIGRQWSSPHEKLPWLPEPSVGVPANSSLIHSSHQVQPLINKSFDLEHVIAAGLEVLLCGRRSEMESQDVVPQSRLSPRLPNPRMNCIQFYPNKIIMACVQNALSMGFLAQDVIMPRCFSPSPFYRPITPADDPKALLAAVTRSTTPVNLKPTLPQLLYPHPAFMDLIPLPVFRARAITLAATQPHMFDMFELKRDMVVEDGLVLWSPAGSGLSSNRRSDGQGQPWDMRSWEAAPWFLRKWRILVDGEDGEVWKQSLWWQRMRGEVEGGVPTS